VVIDTPETDIWRPTARLLAACATADASIADAIASEFLASIPTMPLGTTRIGLVVASTLHRVGATTRAREVADRLLAFVEDHDERVVEPQLRALRAQIS
jgi:hypothetical protein